MRVIFDIDQDFFFFPAVYGDAEAEARAEGVFEQKQTYSIQDFVSDHSLAGRQYTIFKNHEQAYWYIRQMYGHIDKLITFDAHLDLLQNPATFFQEPVSIGNWIGKLIMENRCDSLEWVSFLDEKFLNDISKQTKSEMMKLGSSNYEQKFLNYSSFSLAENQEITEVIFTVSSFFCPSLIVEQFISAMESANKPIRHNILKIAPAPPLKSKENHSPKSPSSSSHKKTNKFVWRSYN